MNDQPKTVGGVLEAAAAYLRGRGVEEPRMACEWLLSRLLKCRRLDLPLRSADALSEPYLAAMRRALKRLAGGEPVQYVLGQWDFMGRGFKVDRRALIPRPETECLVERVLSCGELWARSRPAVADVGTGGGCIIISLALAHPEGLYVGLDVSEEAVALARENAAALGVAGRVAFTCVELSDAVEPEMLDAVVSNPPYIPTADLQKLPACIRDHEPRAALDGGAGGLEVVTAVIEDAAIALKAGGFLFLEIGADQGPAVQGRMKAAGFEDVAVTADLAGRPRVACGRRPFELDTAGHIPP
jgi:release factor glutamine methyltransferase